MKKKNKSVGVALKNKKTYQAQQRLLSKWVVNWKSDQESVIEQLECAMINNDICEALRILGQLKGLTDKRFTALNNVLYILTDPDRKVVDERDEQFKSDNPENVDNKYDVVQPDEINKADEINYSLDRRPTVDIGKIKEIDIDEIVRGYQSGMSVHEISQWNGISDSKTIKILVTKGVYSNDVYDKVKEMRDAGKSDWEIRDTLNLSSNGLNKYTPYKSAMYNLNEQASENAKKLREWKRKKKSIAQNENI